MTTGSRVHSRAPRGGLHLDPAIKIAALRLAEATDAEAIALFGSRVRGNSDDDGDWDFCVNLPDRVEWGRFIPATLRPLLSDLWIPIRRSVVEATKTRINNPCHDIARDGVVIHGWLGRTAAA
ncbi:nucleotidyltransferase domain-containing protein [Microvirga sp. BT689]|uniref:nucleotidyltransferase domain-containing protein n=1 Tax=Microvirga arvi TaxID=2778731 RepID=UPI00195227D1|nr:nucleotidyltransferase domain-containing protein [Microvirga arvi]MBM6583921.1 nucleotidyltransferase domain-containing protein [Microvirga arvi]